MTLLVRAFPVHGREGAARFAEEVRERAEETRQFYENFNVDRESWFFQPTPQGGLVIGVTEFNGELATLAGKFAAAEDSFSSWFKGRVLELSGVDPNDTPAGPPSEQVFASPGSEGVKSAASLAVRAYPVKDRSALQSFVMDLQTCSEDLSTMYGDVRESWFLQQTPFGDIVIAVAAAPNLESAATEYKESQAPFAAWFKQRVMEISGVNPNETPLGPPSEQLFDFRA